MILFEWKTEMQILLKNLQLFIIFISSVEKYCWTILFPPIVWDLDPSLQALSMPSCHNVFSVLSYVDASSGVAKTISKDGAFEYKKKKRKKSSNSQANVKWIYTFYWLTNEIIY